MEEHIEAPFVRELCEDWTIHSYCPRCFATVADSSSAAKVKVAEDEHKCDQRLLEMVARFRKVSHLVSAA